MSENNNYNDYKKKDNLPRDNTPKRSDRSYTSAIDLTRTFFREWGVRTHDPARFGGGGGKIKKNPCDD